MSNKHITAENVEPGMVDLMLDVQKIWDIAHIPAESYEPLSLINEVDKLYLHSTDTDFVMTIKMKDKKQNPLAVLVPFLIVQY